MRHANKPGRILLVAIFLAGVGPVRGDDGFSVTVGTGPCREEILAHGELRAARTVSIHAPEMEEHYLTVKSVLENGTEVKQGDVVMEFEEGLYELALKGASQDLKLKEAELERTRFELEDERIRLDLDIRRKEVALEKAKTEVVPDSNLISQIDLKKAELSVKLAALELEQARGARQEYEKKKVVSTRVRQLQVEEARRQVDRAQENLTRIVVRAPKDGVIYKPFVRLNNEKGRVERNKVVRPGDKLLEIPSFDIFEGVCHLPATDSRLIRVGDPVTISLTVDPGSVRQARVLSRDAYPVTRNERLGRTDADGHLKEHEVVLAIEDRDPILRPGLTFTATVLATLADEGIHVPRAAVHRGAKGRNWVLRTTPAGHEKVEVTVGPEGFTWSVIHSGLKPGDAVILGSP